MPPSIPQIPVVGVDSETLDEKRWRRVSTGETIKTYYQAYLLAMPRPGWRISSFFTSEGEVVSGRTVYRAPASFSAWREVMPQVARKWWTRLIEGED